MSIVYTPITDFLTKDTLPKEDPDKVILGADFSAEFDAISTAFLGAVTGLDPVFTGTVTFEDATGDNLTLSADLAVGGNTVITGTLDAGATTVSTLNAGNTVVTGTFEAGNTTINGTIDASGTITSAGEELQTSSDVQAAIASAELGTVSTLGNLSNVDETGKADGNFLAWDNASGNWEPAALELNSITGDLDVSGVVTAESYHETHSAIDSAANFLIVNCDAATVFTHTLTENTVVIPDNVPASGTAFAFVLKIVQDAGASGFVVTWPTGTVWSEATPPTLSAGASATDVFVMMTHDGGVSWYGFVSGQAFA